MDQILNKVGSYWLGKRANKEINSVGDDFNVCFSLSSPLHLLTSSSIFDFDPYLANNLMKIVNSPRVS